MKYRNVTNAEQLPKNITSIALESVKSELDFEDVIGITMHTSEGKVVVVRPGPSGSLRVGLFEHPEEDVWLVTGTVFGVEVAPKEYKVEAEAYAAIESAKQQAGDERVNLAVEKVRRRV